LGSAGCNDQRIINLAIVYGLPVKQLSVLYNVFCDQYMQHSSDYTFAWQPYVFHYRGQVSNYIELPIYLFDSTHIALIQLNISH